MSFSRISTLSVFLLLFSFSSFAQQSKMDSLEKWVAKYPKKDTVWVKNMVKLEKLYERDNPSKNGTYTDAILAYSKPNNYLHGLKNGLYYKASSYSYKGQYQKAIETIMEKLKIDTKYNDLISKTESYTFLATVFGNINQAGSQQKTLEYFLLANETAQQLPLNHPKRPREIARAKINVASGYYFTQQYEKALKVYLEASAIERKELNSLKDSPEKQKDIAYLNAVSSLNIGSLYYLLNQFSGAEKSYLSGIELAKKYEFPALLVQLYNSISETYLALNKPDISKKYLDIVEEINRKEKLETTSLLIHLDGYKNYYKKIKDFENAYLYQEKLITLNDSLKGKELQQKIKDLTIKYETDKKEQENKQLSEKNAAIERQNKAYLIALGIFLLLLGISAVLYYQLYLSRKVVKQTNLQLEEANSMKNEIFKMISHDLKTPATSFVQLTNNINYFIQHKNYQKLIDLGGYAQNLANDLQSIVSNLLYWSMSQQGLLSKKVEQVFLEDSFHEMKDSFQIYADLHQISLQIIVKQDIAINANRVYLNTVLRNLVSNALKFTDTGGKVILSAEKQDNNVLIKVEDSGSGFTENDINSFNSSKKLGSKLGIRGEKGTGLGLTICREMVELYDGSFSIQNSKTLSGACVSIIFKI